MHAVDTPALSHPSKLEEAFKIAYKGSTYILDTKIVKRPEITCRLVITSRK